jgi:type VII secretion-associated serine protease mycosin
VTVAVIDSGVSRQHPKLADQVLPGMDFVSAGGQGDCDEDGHGTIVAAIIAGKDSPDSPFTGIAPDAKLLPMRILRTHQTQDPRGPSLIAQAIRAAVDRKAQVINLSVQTVPTAELANAINYALSHDVVVIAAAGNEGGTTAGDQPIYPAAYPGIVAVAGTDQQDQHVNTSSQGSYVNVAGPGLQIIGPAPRGGGYVINQAGGTSFSAAYVSGVAALVRSYNPHLSQEEVVNRIEMTADHPPGGWDRIVGYGVVNPYRAVAAVLGDRAGAPAPNGAVLPPPPRADPFGRLKAIAGWAAFAGLLVTVLVLIGAPVIRRGRQRGWRPGRARRTAEPEPTGNGNQFVPVVGRTMSVTAPVNRRAEGGGPPPMGRGGPAMGGPSVRR